MVGSLIQAGNMYDGRLLGIVVDVASDYGETIHKIMWLPSKDVRNAGTHWRQLEKLQNFKVLVKADLYGEEQAKLL